MSRSESAEVEMPEERKHENCPRKRVRHRKKQLYENILKQMEFYFSDANLNKDRFLGELIKKEPYIPLEVFLKFNKIRSMTQDINDIAKAMKNSTILELSEDKTKVKRQTPVLPYNADERTVYVESIPVTASREWLERVFSDYGRVAYISLPRFKNSQRIKDKQSVLKKLMNCEDIMDSQYKIKEERHGKHSTDKSPALKYKKKKKYEINSSFKLLIYPTFPTNIINAKGYGFIEFSKPEEAQKCINTFTNMGCKLPMCMPPEELSSIKMFSADNALEEVSEEKEFEPPKKKAKKIKDKKPQKSLELKLELESDHEKTLDTPTKDDASITTPTEENKLLESESKDELTSQDEGKDGQAPRKKKTRKRTAKERSRAKKNNSKNEAPKGALWGLQVLPKAEWKLLRNKYLNLQRKYMKELKASLQNSRHAYCSIPAPAAPTVGPETVVGCAEDKPPAIERVPGVFVKEEMSEPCFDVRATKRTIRSNVHVCHVEVKEGQTEAIIRFDSAKAAEEYCRLSGRSAAVLSGADEAEQWARIDSGRALSSKRARGRERVLARAAARPAARAALAPASPQPTHTHIRFDE